MSSKLIKVRQVTSMHIVQDIIPVDDINVYKLVITLLEPVTGTAILRLIKPNTPHVDVQAEVNGKQITYILDENDYNYTGILKCYVRLFDGNGGIYTPLLIVFPNIRGNENG